jgi:hypothetical protein
MSSVGVNPDNGGDRSRQAGRVNFRLGCLVAEVDLVGNSTIPRLAFGVGREEALVNPKAKFN